VILKYNDSSQDIIYSVYPSLVTRGERLPGKKTIHF